MCISVIKYAVVVPNVVVAHVFVVVLFCALLFWHTFRQCQQYVSAAVELTPNAAYFAAQVFFSAL